MVCRNLLTQVVLGLDLILLVSSCHWGVPFLTALKCKVKDEVCGERAQPVMRFHTFSDRSYWSHQESCRDRLRGAWKWLWWRSSVSYAKHVQLSLYSMQLQLFMYVLCKSMHLLKRLRCYIQLSHSNSFLHASKQKKTDFAFCWLVSRFENFLGSADLL